MGSMIVVEILIASKEDEEAMESWFGHQAMSPTARWRTHGTSGVEIKDIRRIDNGVDIFTFEFTDDNAELAMMFKLTFGGV